MRVPAPEFQTWKVWLAALFPTVQELVIDVGENAMVGGRTVRVTGIVSGVFDAPDALIVIVAVYIPRARFEVE